MQSHCRCQSNFHHTTRAPENSRERSFSLPLYANTSPQTSNEVFVRVKNTAVAVEVDSEAVAGLVWSVELR
jgi:hypothetical protein